MEKGADPVPEVARVWFLSCIHSLFLPLLILATQRFVPGRPMLPAAGPYTFLAGILLAVPSLPLLWRHWRHRRGDGAVASDSLEQVMIRRRRLMVGVSIADFPALAGVLHYFLTRNTAQGLLLCSVTVVLVYLYRPSS